MTVKCNQPRRLRRTEAQYKSALRIPILAKSIGVLTSPPSLSYEGRRRGNRYFSGGDRDSQSNTGQTETPHLNGRTGNKAKIGILALTSSRRNDLTGKGPPGPLPGPAACTHATNTAKSRFNPTITRPPKISPEPPIF